MTKPLTDDEITRLIKDAAQYISHIPSPADDTLLSACHNLLAAPEKDVCMILAHWQYVDAQAKAVVALYEESPSTTLILNMTQAMTNYLETPLNRLTPAHSQAIAEAFAAIEADVYSLNNRCDM